MEKGEVIPESSTKKWLPLFCQNTIWPSVKRDWRHEKLSQQIDFITHFMNGAPQEIEVKINESQLLKFYQENSTMNSVKKKLKEDSKFKQLLNIFTKKKKRKKKEKKEKKNTQIQRTLFPWTLSQISFPQIALKFATLYLFYPFLSFFCIKFPFINFIVWVVFSNQYPK